MEDESGFLSHGDRADDDTAGTAPRIRRLLASILHDLNARKVSTAVVGETTIYLQIVTHQPDPPPVADHLVPLLRPDYRRQPADRWDLTTQQVLPFIDGSRHIARIATESDVEAALVKACVQNLVYYGVVQLLPLLKYSNVYMCTRSLQRLTKEPALGAACRRFVALECGAGEAKPKKLAARVTATATRGGLKAVAGFEEEEEAEEKLSATAMTENGMAPNGNVEETAQTMTAAAAAAAAAEPAPAAARPRRPSLQKILLMYSFMTHGVNLRTLCQRTAPRENGIDER